MYGFKCLGSSDYWQLIKIKSTIMSKQWAHNCKLIKMRRYKLRLNLLAPLIRIRHQLWCGLFSMILHQRSTFNLLTTSTFQPLSAEGGIVRWVLFRSGTEVTAPGGVSFNPIWDMRSCLNWMQCTSTKVRYGPCRQLVMSWALLVTMSSFGLYFRFFSF